MDAGRSWAVLGGPASTSLFYAPTVQNDEGVSDSVCAVRRFVYWRGGEAQTFNNLFVKIWQTGIQQTPIGYAQD